MLAAHYSLFRIQSSPDNLWLVDNLKSTLVLALLQLGIGIRLCRYNVSAIVLLSSKYMELSPTRQK
jgi:hypothetical protein